MSCVHTLCGCGNAGCSHSCGCHCPREAGLGAMSSAVNAQQQQHCQEGVPVETNVAYTVHPSYPTPTLSLAPQPPPYPGMGMAKSVPEYDYI